MRKRKKKRILIFSAVAAAVLLLTAILLQFAFLTKDVALSVQSTEAAITPGELVTLNVHFADNPGFTDYELLVDYDRTRLELLRVNETYENGAGEEIPYISDSVTQIEIKEENGETYGYIKATCAAPYTAQSGTLCSLTFRILDAASVGVAEVRIAESSFSRANADSGKVRQIDCVTSSGGILVGASDCDHIDEEKDTYCDLCSKQIAHIETFDVASSNMTLGNELELNFLVKKSDVDGMRRNLIAHVTHETKEEAVVWEIPKSRWELIDGYYKISVGVAASQMVDRVSLQIKDGQGYVYNNAYATSVRDYAGRMLNQDSVEDTTKTLIVDMLNYGASAQRYFDYKADDLANNILTEEMQQMASGAVACTDLRVQGSAYTASALSLEEQILLNMIFDGISAQWADGMYAEISFTDVLGEEKFFVVPGKEFKRYGVDGYVVGVDQIVLADASIPVTVTLKNAAGGVIGSATDSVQSYISRMAQDDETGLYSNIMKFSVSAYNYVMNK